jgi:putative membrane protein
MKNAFRASRAAAAVGTIAVLCAAVLGADAQSAFNPPLASRPMVAPTMAPVVNDLEFASAATAINNVEIGEARLALQRSRNARVRNFAQRMIDDHATAAVQLQAATRGLGQKPAPVIGVTKMARDQYLMLVNSTDFDAQYMLAQVPNDRAAIAALNWEVTYGREAGLRDYASRVLPIEEQHLRLAETFVASNGASLGVGPDGSNAVINPPGRGPNNGTFGTQVDNNPATGSNGGTQGQNSPTNPTQSNAAPAATPGYPIGGSGTPPPLVGSPAPAPTRKP